MLSKENTRQYIDMVLDVHTTEVTESESGHFLVSLNTFMDAFATSNPFEVYPKQRVNLVVTITEVKVNRINSAKCHRNYPIVMLY